MSWTNWVEELRQAPLNAVTDLLRGAADVSPYERLDVHEFLRAVMPRKSLNVSHALLGEPDSVLTEDDQFDDLPVLLDSGLSAWFLAQRQSPLPSEVKRSAYAAQVCEALQLPLYFALPQSRTALTSGRAQWLQWLGPLYISDCRDPVCEYLKMIELSLQPGSVKAAMA